MTTRNYDEEGQDHTTTYNYTFDDKMNGYKLKTLRSLIDVHSVERVLEVGCYEGGMTKELNALFPKVDVVEPSERCIQHLRSRGYPNRFIHSILEDYRTDDKYDLIIISHTLEHIEDRQRALKTARSMLTPSGCIFVVVPNGMSLSRRIAHRLGVVPYLCAITPSEAEHGHHITYDLPSLEREMRSADLELVSSGGIMVKVFGNRQYDLAMANGIIDDAYLDACYALSGERPSDCSSIYCLAKTSAD